MRNFFIILLLFGGSSLLFAQSAGTIKGFVKEGDAPVAYANVYLTLKTDSTKIKAGTVTGSAGEFILEKIPFENYVLHVQMIGYVSKKTDITLSSTIREIDLNTLSLEADALLLNAVEVVAAKELIQKTEDGFVIKASDNITQIGGTAADLLKNMPEELLKKALAINPMGIDPNYFYADYLAERERFAEAMRHPEIALKAPARPGRELADSGRRQEIQALISKVKKEME